MASKDGVAIILAWPETYCKQAGGWYDPFLSVLGFSKNRYYKVGHAAIVLISKEKGECHYFDFGRYHAPFGYGRVRSKNTDDELAISLKGDFDENGKLVNYDRILDEIVNKEACHGTGTLHASQLEISFESAYLKATEMQSQSPLKYGPLIPKGTNCSRFVRSVMKAGSKAPLKKVQLHFPRTFSPTPIGNVRLFGNYQKLAPLKRIENNAPSKKSKAFLKSTLPEPNVPIHLPENVQWLAGKGGGSWFHLEKNREGIQVARFDQNGNLECSASFYSQTNSSFELNELKVAHPSHCSELTVMVGSNQMKLYRR